MSEQTAISKNLLLAQMVRRRLGPVLGRVSFRHFVQLTMPQYQEARHHRLIMEALQLVERGLIRFLIISMPPRHGKSELVSVRFPAWYLGRHPDRNIIHVSYGSELSNEFSRRVRALVRSDDTFRVLFPGVELDIERQRINDWRLAAGGGFRSVGTGAGITGHGANLLLVDDPHKEGETDSLTILQQVFDWYGMAARTRLAPGGAVVICMTRWAPLDLVGQVIRAANSSPEADQWQVLTLPALAGEDDALGRAPGEALWPEWFPVESLLSVRALSESHFLALYQQDPRAGSAQMFFGRDFHKGLCLGIGSGTPAFCFDLALGEADGGDYSAYALVTYDRETGEMQFSHLFRDRVLWPALKERIKTLMKLYPTYDFVFPRHVYELMAVQELKYELPEMAGRIRQVSFPAGSDKTSRAQVFSDRVGAGKVSIEENGLAELWIQEHEDFPSGNHDDCVDVSSVATHYFGLHGEFSAAIADADAQARQRAWEIERKQQALERVGYVHSS